MSTADFEAGFKAGLDAGFAEWAALADAVQAISPRALIPHDGPAPTLPVLAERLAQIDPARLSILRPFDPAEAITLQQAGDLAGRHANTVGEWVEKYRIGRPVVGRVLVSHPALAMLLDGDALALATWLAGRREDPLVLPYLQRTR